MIAKSVAYVVRCEYANCSHEYKGRSGQTPGAVMTDAWDAGWWSTDSDQHYCPDHRAFAVEPKARRKLLGKVGPNSWW
jgi:hypothetical protein